MKPSQGRKSRPKFVLLPQFSTPRGLSLFSLQPPFPPRLPPFLQEWKLPFILAGVDVTTMKGIVCPRPLLRQCCGHQSDSMKVSLCLWQLHPGRVWKTLMGVTSREAACEWISPPCSFSAKFSQNFSVKLFFLYIALLLSTFTSSATVVFNYPLRIRNTDESAFRMQTRMMARDHSYFLLDSCPTSHLFPDTAITTLLPM